MKSLVWVGMIWMLAATLLGLLGDALLTRAWRQDAVDSFLRDVGIGQAIVRTGTWSKPYELDPNWVAIESLLDADMLPVVGPGSAADVAQAGAERDDNRNSAAVPTWLPTASGRYRLSLNAMTELNGETVGLRFTREVSSPSVRTWWWLMLGLTQLIGLVCALLGLRLGLGQLAKQRIVLTPWLNALRFDGNNDRLLPPIEEMESELEPALTLIAERVNRTVAELENHKQRSDLVFGNLQEGVLAVDERSSILLANKALLELLNIQDESYLNRPLLEIIRAPIVRQLIEQVLRRKIPSEATCEYGSPGKQLRLQANPLSLGRKRIGALLTVHDETMLKRIESIRRDFVTNASHELKTPLAAIRAYAETLQMGAIEDREAAEGFIANIISQADRINGLVQGMLQLSRVQSGTGLRIESFEAAEALEPCLAAVAAMAKSKGVAMHCNLPDDELNLQTDRDGFQTIVSNLLSNAVRYTPEGGSVTLTVQADEKWLTVVVADTGIGIQQADLERIFERFYRAEKDRSADTGGTGLGLSIVKNLVQALNGTVNATSQPNKGSRFEVRLPLSHASAKID